jgi:hypothetical protein
MSSRQNHNDWREEPRQYDLKRCRELLREEYPAELKSGERPKERLEESWRALQLLPARRQTNAAG